ncbi:hypothetical protein [Methylicorpusculum sp.]|uniref:hypothetical protein n=1 Tax=Methylicorpusculum sp. TaxID=2713644 RepID=UPI0027305FCA|nr:hypothetical protein [Methylicorpusculum sp.]
MNNRKQLANASTGYSGSNSQFDLFGVILGWEKPFEERRKPFHGGLTAASLLPTSSKSFPQPFFLFKLRIADLAEAAVIKGINVHQLRYAVISHHLNPCR